jgi:murein L,D-transpeptidase YafK
LLLVETSAHTLLLCENGAATRRFPVALGRGGTGKTKTGDERTPLGEYRLEAPRASSRFGVFLPVGYPTKKQSLEGLSGADIGIHGPDRRFTWLGGATVWADWTSGCVALGSDTAIQAVAAWVKTRGVTEVRLQ